MRIYVYYKIDFKLMENLIIYSKGQLEKTKLNKMETHIDRLREDCSQKSLLHSLRERQRMYEPIHSLCPLVFAFAYKKEEINIRIKREQDIQRELRKTSIKFKLTHTHTHTY